MNVQEYILLIFAAISFWTEPISADVFQAYDWPTSTDFSGSLPTGTDKSSFEDNTDEDDLGNFYDYTVKNLDGQIVCLNEYAGKVLIIVNYACGCGFTVQNVCALSELAKKYKRQGLEILIFPSNDFFQNFGGDIAAKLLADNYPEFNVFSEICVNGKAQHPLYRFLKNKLPGAFNSKAIKWNFTKFVVDKNGCPIQRYSVKDSFKDIEEKVQELLMDQSRQICYD